MTPWERWYRGWVSGHDTDPARELELECEFLSRVDEAFRVHRQLVWAPKGLRPDAAIAIVDAHRTVRRS